MQIRRRTPSTAERRFRYPQYEAGSLKKSLLGEAYRDVWTTALDIPVIDLERTAGGLTPLEVGGGFQTTTLHLKGEDGHFYVLRSVNKVAERIFPEGVRGTIVQDVAQDYLSSLNPVGALAVPPLAEAAGIPHTCPRLTVIPDSPRLGKFRDQLPEVASQYYELLAETVDVVGSDDHERFEVERLGDGTTRVVIFKTEEEETIERELYRRVFHHDETHEVRLYGFRSKDYFVVKGEAEDGLRIRLIGGEGEDTFVVEEGAAGARKTHIYDTAHNTELEVEPKTTLHLTAYEPVDDYVEQSFLPATGIAPGAVFDYDSDDGVLMGGTVRLVRRAYRKDPYAVRHILSLAYAPRSRAYHPRYDGHLVDLWQGLGAHVELASVIADNYRSFYGLGNETPAPNRYRYLARLRTVTAVPSLRYTFGHASAFEAGPRFEFISTRPPGDRPADDPRVGFTPDQLTDSYFVGVQTSLVLDGRDTLSQAPSGFVLATETSVNLGVRGTEQRFARLASELSYYYTLDLPIRFTLALRAGGATNVGDFTFYQANTLGGAATLRGYPRTRFAGRSTIYTNAELRARLFEANLNVVKGDVGLLGFVDHGRVWADEEESDAWHRGYGGGLWMRPFDLFMVMGSVGVSPEGRFFDLSAGFFF